MNFTLGWPASVSPSEVVRSCQHGLAEVRPLNTVVMDVLICLFVSQFGQLILCGLTFLSLKQLASQHEKKITQKCNELRVSAETEIQPSPQ